MAAPSQRPAAMPAGRLKADVSRILAATSGASQAQPGKTPVLILTIGLPGSGKSTFCRRLAPQIDAVILESDAIRRLLFAEPRYSRAESRRLFDAMHVAARELLLRGWNVIIDATSVKEADRRPVYELAKGTGARLLQLNFSASPAIIEERLTNRMLTPAQDDNSSAGLGVYARMAALTQAPRGEYWDIDTSNYQAVEAVLNRVVEDCRSDAGRVMGGTS